MKEALEQLRRLTRDELMTLKECVVEAANSERRYGSAKSKEESEKYLHQIHEKLAAMVRATRGKR